MSDLDRILKLSGLVQGNGFAAPVEEGKMSDMHQDAQENSKEDWLKMYPTMTGADYDDIHTDMDDPNNNESVETEAVGSFADPILDLCDEVGCDPDHPVLADLIRYLDGDTIADFVKEFRSNHEYDNGMEYESAEVDEASCGSKKKHKHESTEEVGEAEVVEAEGMRTIEVNKDIQLAGDSIWDKRNENMTQMVHVKEISISEDEDGYLSVTVEHDGPWEIYTDTAFPEAISELCGCEVDWSEQGMQDEGMAHLEGELMEAYESISETFHTELMRELKD